MGSCVLRETMRVVRGLLRAFPSCKAETEKKVVMPVSDFTVNKELNSQDSMDPVGARSSTSSGSWPTMSDVDRCATKRTSLFTASGPSSAEVVSGLSDPMRSAVHFLALSSSAIR